MAVTGTMEASHISIPPLPCGPQFVRAAFSSVGEAIKQQKGCEEGGLEPGQMGERALGCLKWGAV